ncbi:MAG: PQQ-binding-like beta-propeller repeat protein [Haloarculaceae archaeon]
MKGHKLLALSLTLVLCGSAATVAFARVPSNATDDDLTADADAKTNHTDDAWSTSSGDAAHTASNGGKAPVGPNVTQSWKTDWARFGEPTTPAVANGTVYVGYQNGTGRPESETDGNVVAYDADSENVTWIQEDLPRVDQTPTVVDGHVYVTSEDDRSDDDTDPPAERAGVYALHAATGEVAWTRNEPAFEDTYQHVYGDGRLYVSVVGDDEHLYALNASTGATIWKTPLDTPSNRVQDVSYANGTILTRSYDGNPYGDRYEIAVDAYDASSGERRWSTSLSNANEPSDTLFMYDGSDTQEVATADGVVYLSLQNQELYALSLDDGRVRWNRSLTSSYTDETPDWISAPAVHDGAVYVTTQYEDVYDRTEWEIGTVHRIDVDTGETEWRYESAARLLGPAVANETVYLGAKYRSVDSQRRAADGNPETSPYPSAPGVYALNATSGDVRWTKAEIGVSEESYTFKRYTTQVAPAEGALYVRQANSAFPFEHKGSVYELESTTKPVDPGSRFADDTPLAKNLPPIVDLSTNPSNATDEELPNGTNVTMTVDASDPDGNVTSIEWDVDNDGAYERDGASITLDLDCGLHDVTLRVTDDDGAATVETYTIDIAP